MFNELQEAKIDLETQKQMMMQLQQEKEEIVAVMHQAAVSLHFFRGMSSDKS